MSKSMSNLRAKRTAADVDIDGLRREIEREVRATMSRQLGEVQSRLDGLESGLRQRDASAGVRLVPRSLFEAGDEAYSAVAAAEHKLAEARKEYARHENMVDRIDAERKHGRYDVQFRHKSEDELLARRRAAEKKRLAAYEVAQAAERDRDVARDALRAYSAITTHSVPIPRAEDSESER